MTAVKINDNIAVGDGSPLVAIAGPCVMESVDFCVETAAFLKEVFSRAQMPFIFKASFDKANRTSIDSFRGPGIKKGLQILAEVKGKTGVPVITDIHLPSQAAPAAEVVDILQIPAFLSRQTDLIVAAAETGLPLNVKKGQFMAPADMKAVLNKAEHCGNKKTMFCERGSSFGYHDLVVDMRSIPRMQSLGQPVIFDLTHSTQRPGALGTCSGGDRGMVETLGKAAVAAGADGIFMETHPHPQSAPCDSETMIPLKDVAGLIKQLKAVASVSRKF